MNNYTKYKDDLEKLLGRGELLLLSLYIKFHPKSEKVKQKLPDFYGEYQMWYSESYILIKQLLIDRLADFKSYYEKPKNRKQINHENYCIEDALQNLGYRNNRGAIIVDQSAAIPKFKQQLAILKSINARFESSLFDITQLLQADLFDSELKMGEELLNKGFIRASGAITGVVLEKHLSQVLKNHNVTITKKQPAINDLNELLKNNNIIDIPTWRLIQRFGDIRNLCDHNNREPTNEEVLDLIRGVEKITKTLF
jgi:galactitol-specific phosphotransferase system IIB component